MTNQKMLALYGRKSLLFVKPVRLYTKIVSPCVHMWQSREVALEIVPATSAIVSHSLVSSHALDPRQPGIPNRAPCYFVVATQVLLRASF